MKTTTTALLCLLIIFTPTHRPKATLLPFCIAITAVVVAAGVAVYVSSCAPKYYCSTSDDQPEPVCRIISIQERKSGEFKIISGPYKDAKLCDEHCSTNAPTSLLSIASSDQCLITIEKSYDLKTWATCGSVVGDPLCFEWSETNVTLTACFYRAKY